MRRSRRKLEIGDDGMANVMLLTDPIPRHVSLVSWGANDQPAVSWKSVEPVVAHHVLRSPPGEEVTDPSTINGSALTGFIGETLDAWIATVMDTMGTPLSSEERGARVRALTVQAGARVAAAATALGNEALSSAAASFKRVGLELPELPTGSTLHSEIDRRRFSAAMENAAAALTDLTLDAMKGSGPGHSATESILTIFGDAADAFSSWASSMPRGVVGVTASTKAGHRHSSNDRQKLEGLKQQIEDLLGDEGKDTSPETAMKITLADLQAIATENPKGFLDVITKAVGAVNEGKPAGTQKFFWGETGEMPFDADQILRMLEGNQGGEALIGIIAGAVGGVDIDGAAAQNTQVNATMRGLVGKMVHSELTNNPEGHVATAIKAAVAPAVAETVKAVLDGGYTGNEPVESLLDFQMPEGADPLTADLPGSSLRN